MLEQAKETLLENKAVGQQLKADLERTEIREVAFLEAWHTAQKREAEATKASTHNPTLKGRIVRSSLTHSNKDEARPSALPHHPHAS